MAPQSVPIRTFQGLDLRNDPQEMSVGAAVDGLNVSLAVAGRLVSRDGYAKLTAAPATNAYSSLMPYYQTNSATRRLVAGQGGVGAGQLDLLTTAGAVTSSVTTSVFPHHALLRFGSTASERVLAFPFRMNPGPDAYTSPQQLVGTSWSTFTVGGLYGAVAACVQKTDNRAVVAAPLSVGAAPTLWFSDAGNPTSYVSPNTLDLTPGDGENILNLTSWRDLVFAFKQTKFFVFYGNETTATGTSIFNYRPVDAGTGCMCHRGAVAAPEGIYYLDRTGVYLTTGSTPTKVSAPLDPLFGRGSLPSYYQGSAINWASIEWATLDYYNGRLFMSVPTGVSTTNDATFVLEVATGQWMPWSTKVNGMTSFRIGDQEEMVFSLASGSNDVVRVGQPGTYTTDAGTAISGRYRMGFWSPGDPVAEWWVREVLLQGSGTVTVKTAVNDAVTLGSGQAVTLGTAPAVAQGRDRRGLRGRNVSYEFSGTAPWSLSSVVPIVWGQRSPGEQAA